MENKRDYSQQMGQTRQAIDKAECMIGNIFDLQTAEMAAATKKVIENMSAVVDFYEAVFDLIRLKDPCKSTIFLLVLTICLLCLEAALACLLLSLLVYI